MTAIVFTSYEIHSSLGKTEQ